MNRDEDKFAGTSLGVDVVLDEEIMRNAPHCVHGPTLLFERYFRGQKSGRRFFACSACRDRKDCDFFQYEDDKVSEIRKQARAEFNQSKQPQYSHQEYYQRFEATMNLEPSQRGYCHKCNLLLLPGETKAHQDHTDRVVKGLTSDQMKEPSHVLDPIENKKTNAQYLYNTKAVGFLISTIKSMGCDRVLCVGTPRLHESIMRSKVMGEKDSLDSLLLDIDHRYYQFYPPNCYCRYNMFNHHFFDGADSQQTFQKFLLQNGGQGVVMVTDPPFGGLVEVLAFTVNRIMSEWKAGQSDSCSDSELPVIWTFPYFQEFRILKSLPSFHMSDYKVEYDNHALFQCGKKNKGSPVRLFTNIPPLQFKLPEDDGYRLCTLCQRYVSAENIHCTKCGKCTSKDGRRYTHCDQCNKCVKPGRVHCISCNHCELPDHVCVQNRALVGCHICGDPTHKRRDCPQHLKKGKTSKKRKHHIGNTRKKPGDSSEHAKKLKTEGLGTHGQKLKSQYCQHHKKNKKSQNKIKKHFK